MSLVQIGKVTGVMLAAVIVAITAGLFAFSAAVRSHAPDRVPAFWHDPLAPMLAWGRTLAAQPNRIGEDQTRDVALRALRVQPLNPAALRMLAIWAASREQLTQAYQLADLSQRVSRRDLPGQMFLIERAVGRGDVNGALAHYDIALRTSPDSRQLLFPVLTAAMTDPAIRRALTPYVRHSAPWMGGFLFNALDLPGGASSVARLLLASGGHGRNDLLSGLAPGLLARLVGLREFALAEQLFLLTPKADAAMLQDPSFTVRTTDLGYGPFGWQSIDTADASIAFEPLDRDRRRLYVSARPGAVENQSLLQRTMRLLPGDYRFAEQRASTSGNGSIVWRLTCLNTAENPAQIWMSSPSGQTAQSAVLHIPTSCEWQQIELLASGGRDIAIDVTFNSISFNRIGSVSLPARP